MEYYPAIKKNKIMPFAATWMDLEIIILSEVRQRKINITWYVISLICGTLKNNTNDVLYIQNRNRLTDIEDKLMVTKREWGEG